MPRSISSSKSDAADTSTLKIFIGGKSKVKTGCLTCKKRHMKCDETKPACTKCTSTGRICDGYIPPPKNRKRKIVHDDPKSKASPTATPPSPNDILNRIFPPLSLLPDCTQQELRSIDFFVKSTMQQLVPWHKANFWDQHAPKVMYSEPSVRHAIIAMSVTQEHLLYVYAEIADDRRLEHTITQNRKKFALHNYNLSVGLLAKTIGDRGHDAQEITLINCIIFVVLNCMCGDIKTALAHLDCGGKVLDRWKDGLAKNRRISNGGLEEDLPTVFAALGLESKGERARSSREQTPFTNLDIAEDELKAVAEEINIRVSSNQQNLLEQVENGENHRHNQVVSHKQNHHQRLKQWSFKFEGLVDAQRQDFTAIQEDQMSCLRIRHLSTVSRLWASSSKENTDPFEILSNLVEGSEVLRKGCWKDGIDLENDTFQLCDSRTWPAHSVENWNTASPACRRKALMLLKKIMVTT